MRARWRTSRMRAWLAGWKEAGGPGIIVCGGAPLDWVEEQGAYRPLDDRQAHRRERQRSWIRTPPRRPSFWRSCVLTPSRRARVLPRTTCSCVEGRRHQGGTRGGPSIALAARMERLGADAVVAEGTEAGGHIGELTTMALPSPQYATPCPSRDRRGGHRRRRKYGRPRLLGSRACRQAPASSRWTSAPSPTRTKSA